MSLLKMGCYYSILDLRTSCTFKVIFLERKKINFFPSGEKRVKERMNDQNKLENKRRGLTKVTLNFSLILETKSYAEDNTSL